MKQLYCCFLDKSASVETEDDEAILLPLLKQGFDINTDGNEGETALYLDDWSGED
jgi:hypothetical protein